MQAGGPATARRRVSVAVSSPPTRPTRPQSLTLVVDQRIQRNTFEVGRNGAIDADYRVLAEDLPLPIAR